MEKKCCPEDRHQFCSLKKLDIFYSRSNTYMLDKLLGNGTYGVVAECTNVVTTKKWAIKFVRKDVAIVGIREIAILKKIRRLDDGRNNLVKLIDDFKHSGNVCLVFEVLHLSLYDYLESRSFQPLWLTEIRVIVQQMLVALDFLDSISVIHTDITPENIMLVNHQHQPFRVKLIDFGLAVNDTDLHAGRLVQALGYRAPEVYLGLRLFESIDMWSLGCVMAFLYLGWHLYPVKCKYQGMKAIVEMNGMPSKRMLKYGVYSHYYFTKNSTANSWYFNTEEEFTYLSGIDVVEQYSNQYFSDLSHITKARPREKAYYEMDETWNFINFFKQTLEVNPSQRLTPSNGLKHSFITMEHLRNACDRSYVASAISVLEKSQQKASTLTSSFDDTCSSNNSSATCSLDNTKITPTEDNRTPQQNHKSPPQKTGADDAKTTETGPNEGNSAPTNSNRFTRTVRVIKKRVTRFFSRMIRRTNSQTPNG